MTIEDIAMDAYKQALNCIKEDTKMNENPKDVARRAIMNKFKVGAILEEK